MKGSEFIKRVQKLAKARGVLCSWHADMGKGSHGVLKFGDARTVVRNPKDELKTGTYHAMLKQLKLTDKDLFQENTMQRFAYPVALTSDISEGGFTVTCRDIPEAITQGDDLEAAIEAAEGALEAAIEMRIADGIDIPLPSKPRKHEQLIGLPVAVAMKAAIYLAMAEQGVSKSDLARRMQLDEKEARRILDPRHATRVGTLERALHALGKRAEVVVA